MKVLILSDLHLEFAPFEPEPGLEFDVVILAGDIHSPAKRAVQWAADRFRGKPVVYLLGNHEYYDGRLDTTLAEARRETEGSTAGPPIHSRAPTPAGWPARLAVTLAMRMLGMLECRERFHTASARTGHSNRVLVDPKTS